MFELRSLTERSADTLESAQEVDERLSVRGLQHIQSSGRI